MRHRYALLIALLTLLPLSSAPAADDAPVATEPAHTPMTPEQAAFAARFEWFMAEKQRWFFDSVKRLNGSAETETREWKFDDADHTVSVTRGPVVEKAAWYLNVAKKGIPPFLPSVRYSRYMEVDVHPKNPHVGFLHATLFFVFLENGKSMMAGYMDYVPAVWHDEDNAELKSAVEKVYTEHGVDITRFRKQLCESKFGAAQHRDRLKAACVGASLYDPPMMEIDAAHIALATQAWQSFVETYFSILERRQKQAFGAAELQAQAAMRKRWLEDQLFADTFTMKVVPYEVWSFADQAPTIRF